MKCLQCRKDIHKLSYKEPNKQARFLKHHYYCVKCHRILKVDTDPVGVSNDFP